MNNDISYSTLSELLILQQEALCAKLSGNSKNMLLDALNKCIQDEMQTLVKVTKD